MKKLQYQLSNGRWVEAEGDRVELLIGQAVEYSAGFHALRPETPALDRDGVLSALDAGKSVKTGTDWYSEIRLRREPVASPPVDLVRCSCGHSVPSVSVLRASRGSACPDCYDRLSN